MAPWRSFTAYAVLVGGGCALCVVCAVSMAPWRSFTAYVVFCRCGVWCSCRVRRFPRAPCLLALALRARSRCCVCLPGLGNPCLPGGLEEGGSAMSSLRSQGSPTLCACRKSYMATSPLPSQGPKKRAELLCSPCVLGGYQSIFQNPKQKKTKSKLATHPCLLGGPKQGGIAT